MNNVDTIAAVSTPSGESAIALLRATGPECSDLAIAIFGLKKEPAARRSNYGAYRSLSGELLDDVVFCLYRGPASFTGEDTLEIACHGNPLIATRILEDLIARGCRQSEPGEFTRRAFLNGRMDLTQAEAVMELIRARSDKAILAANNQLRGAFGRQLDGLKDDLLDSVAAIEAYIDFPEEDLPPEQKAAHLERIQKLVSYCSKLIDGSRYAAFLREGVKTLIIGEPNAGKSSLLNRMLGFERAIVSEEPGTTRDFLRERVIVGPHCIQLMDTAGLRESMSQLEARGIEKTIELAEEADLFLLVIDSTLPSPTLPDSIRSRLSAENCVVLRNKIDLKASLPLPVDLEGFESVLISSLTGQGIDALRETLVRIVDARFATADEDLILINSRHSASLGELKACLQSAYSKLDRDDAAELVASDMRGALDAIGRILGRIDNERMLDRLFGSFCIGK